MTRFRRFLRIAQATVWRHRGIVLLLLVSAALRCVLVLRGGQYYSQDEPLRFHPCLNVVSYLQRHEVGAALDVIAARTAHVGFFLVGTLTATAYIGILAMGIVHPSERHTLWIPALMLSTASLACIALTYAIARRAGADRDESFTAAFLMACSATMFYYARHLLPYDSSLAFALAALWVGLKARTSLSRSALVGMLASLAFLTWYGTLITACVVSAVHVLRVRRPSALATRAVGVVLGSVVLPLGLHAMTLARRGVPFLNGVRAHMATATQGDFAEGWRVVWEYLWHAEHGLLCVWIAGTLTVLLMSLPPGRTRHVRGLVWVAAAVAIYTALCLESTVLHRAVVLGRVTRELVPFMCLAAAYAIRMLDRDLIRSRLVLRLGAAALVLQAALNFAPPLAQRFPFELDRELMARYGNAGVTHELSVEGPGVPEMRQANWPSPYVLLNTVTYLYPVLRAKAPMVHGTVIVRASHPLQFTPYQYEQFGPTERAIVRSTDISMRLVAVADHDG